MQINFAATYFGFSCRYFCRIYLFVPKIHIHLIPRYRGDVEDLFGIKNAIVGPHGGAGTTLLPTISLFKPYFDRGSTVYLRSNLGRTLGLQRRNCYLMLFNHSVQNIWQVQQKVSPQVLKEELVRWLCNLHWLLVSKGERLGATKLDAQRQDGQVIVSWNLAAETKLSSGNDMLMLLALNTTTLECSCNLDAGRRSKGQAFIPEPPALPNEKILLFIAFRKIIGTAKKSLTNISTSQWVEVE